MREHSHDWAGGSSPMKIHEKAIPALGVYYFFFLPPLPPSLSLSLSLSLLLPGFSSSNFYRRRGADLEAHAR